MAPAQVTGRCFPVTSHWLPARSAISLISTGSLINVGCAAERGSWRSGLSWSSGWRASP